MNSEENVSLFLVVELITNIICLLQYKPKRIGYRHSVYESITILGVFLYCRSKGMFSLSR